MFKKRKLVVSLDRQDKDGTSEPLEPKQFEAKADYVIHKLEGIGGKVFLGFCVYILLDTYRQVQVANAIYQPQTS